MGSPRSRAAGWLTLILVLAALGQVLEGFHLRLATDALIFAVLAMGLDLLVGYSGLPSLGHAAFFGSSAYTAGIVARDHSDVFVVGATAGIAVATGFALLFGLLALRTAGAYFLMITFALAQLLVGVALRWRSVTGGADGMGGIRRPELGVGFVDLNDSQHFYYFCAVIALAVAALLWLVVRSPFGLTLEGIRDNEVRMASLGYHIWLHRYVAFVLSGALGGLAGVLVAYHDGFVSPELLGLATSADVLLMVILGGAGTVFGPLIGAGAVILLGELAQAFTDRWRALLGLLYVATVFLARGGLWRGVPKLARVMRARAARSGRRGPARERTREVTE